MPTLARLAHAEEKLHRRFPSQWHRRAAASKSFFHFMTAKAASHRPLGGLQKGRQGSEKENQLSNFPHTV
jgi:hypothetical protein